MNLPWSFNLHRAFARLHGGGSGESTPDDPGDCAKFESAYADYAAATTQANAMLQRHGRESKEFASADVSSMRLFHRVKKMQGLGKPNRGQRG